MNPVRIVAFTKSMNKEPTSGTTMNAVGAGNSRGKLALASASGAVYG